MTHSLSRRRNDKMYYTKKKVSFDGREWTLHIITDDRGVFWVSANVAEMLWYENPQVAIQDIVSYRNKSSFGVLWKRPCFKLAKSLEFINEEGFWELERSSKNASDLRVWAWHAYFKSQEIKTHRVPRFK